MNIIKPLSHVKILPIETLGRVNTVTIGPDDHPLYNVIYFSESEQKAAAFYRDELEPVAKGSLERVGFN